MAAHNEEKNQSPSSPKQELTSKHRRKRLLLIAVVVVILFLHRQSVAFSSMIDDMNDYSPIDDTSAINETNTQITKRGGGFLTTHTGCRISKWLYSQESGTQPLFKECKAEPPNRQLRLAIQLQENDTLFVPFTAMQQFVDEVLDEIPCNIFIISGQTHIVPKIADETLHKLLNHTHVTHWFAHNLPVYGGTNPYHPKISPFPYGLKETEGNGKLIFESYKRVFFRSILNKTATDKTTFIYAGPLGKTQPGRRKIKQSSTDLPPEEYFMNMAKSHYILSPNGDRPDCHRHYEAIGLGTIPITELDPVLFRHLADGPAVYNIKDWKLSSLGMKLDPKPTVNRNLVREDYWMDWADKEAGVKLNWRLFEKATGKDEWEQSLMAMIDI